MDLFPGLGVVYVDPVGKHRAAILTAVWNSGQPEKYPNPCVNVVFVSDDEARADTYGRQIERATSIPHKSSQTAHGNYWRRLEE